MTKLIKKMENCSESSFIFICKNVPSGVAIVDRAPGLRGAFWVVRPPARRLVSNSNGDNPTKKDFY